MQIDKVQIETEGRRSREFARTTRPPTQNEPRTSYGGNHTRTVSTTCRSNLMRNVDFAHSCTGCRAHRLHPGVSRRSCVRFLLEPMQVQLGSLRYELASPERAHRSSLLAMLFIRRCGVLYRQCLSRRCGVPRSQLLRQWHSFVFLVTASMTVCCGSSSLRCVRASRSVDSLLFKS